MLCNDFSNEMWGFYDSNQKIQAIKFLREKTGLGLKECKDAMDFWWNQKLFPNVFLDLVNNKSNPNIKFYASFNDCKGVFHEFNGMTEQAVINLYNILSDPKNFR